MAPSACIELSIDAQRQLLAIARQAIYSGIATSASDDIRQDKLAEVLTTPCGAFVTLTIDRRLRGCVGVLASDKALVDTVADAACSAAFKDHRFEPLVKSELEHARIEISVLSQTEPMLVSDRENLEASLRPHVDGLVLSDGRHRATFLPKVWEQLPTAEEFLDQLLLKAGLGIDHWSDNMVFERYTATSFCEAD